MRFIRLLFLLALTPSCVIAQQTIPVTSHAGQAQFSLDADRELVISLKGKWHFQPGDSPAYASPTFDDSQWPLLDSDRSFSEQGYKGLSGLAWYRFRVTLPAGSEPMALYLPSIATCYQVFADGNLIGTAGQMPPHPAMYDPATTVFSLPARIRSEPQSVTIALRIWHDPAWASYVGGGPEGVARLGQASLIRDREQKFHQARSWRFTTYLILATIEMIASLISLALYLLRRSEREFVWFAVLSLSSACLYVLSFYAEIYTRNVNRFGAIVGAVNVFNGVAFLFFYRALFKGRFNLLFWIAITAVGISYVDRLLIGFHLLSNQVSQTIEVLLGLPSFIWVLLLLYKRVRDRLPDAKFLIFPLLISTASGILGSLDFALDHLGLPPLPFSLVVIHSPVEISYSDVAELLFLLAMLAILIARFARTSRNQDRIASEFDAARTLQHVLIPEDIPRIPNLTIATAYHPAMEVGGDFFQILPLPTQDTLIVLGDVAGKGLPAAMTVSLLVGALRTLAEQTHSPAEILAGLNRRLLGRGSGFTTCLILRISPTGILTLANAGHLPPYRNGQELPTEASLPLGLSPVTTFTEQTHQLAPKDHLTLLTDGVPEAQSRHELFGFARTEALSLEPAATIARTARAFGQTDDITVLSVIFAIA